MNSSRTVKLTIDSRLECVELVGVAVSSICYLVPLSEIDAYQAELCVVEAVTNAIKHAYQNDPDNEVVVRITLAPPRIIFEVSDQGLPITEFGIPNFDFDPADIEYLPEGGMGLYIIDSVMDDVCYFSKNGVNTLRMIKSY